MSKHALLPIEAPFTTRAAIAWAAIECGFELRRALKLDRQPRGSMLIIYNGEVIDHWQSEAWASFGRSPPIDAWKNFRTTLLTHRDAIRSGSMPQWLS